MIELGHIKLPRFQRFEAWDRQRITSLFNTVVHDLPLGITLVLEVGEQEKFISRYLATGPETGHKVYEQLLDGQQRLTALWRVFKDNYDWESYFVYCKPLNKYWDVPDDEDDVYVYCQPRYLRKNGKRYPLWADVPAECLNRGCIPSSLFRPGDIQKEIDTWIESATARLRPQADIAELERFLEFRKAVSDQIKDLRAVIANYNLPYLALPSATEKATALNVFINMNTNSKPLSSYDIVVAEVEAATGVSLHDMQAQLDAANPEIVRYRNLSELILSTAALLQGLKPGERGVQNLDVKQMVDDWGLICTGLIRMAEFLQGQGIFDEQRLPTKSVLPVIASLYARVPDDGDQRGRAENVLRRYLWRACFCDRYESSAESNAFADHQALASVIESTDKDDGSSWEIQDVPIFRSHALIEPEELLTAVWPKNLTIAGRGVLAVACRLGAQDFSTGKQVTAGTIRDRQYHHVFPDALLREAEINGFLALNCALIEGATNLHIGRKEPLKYLADRYQWADEAIVAERLNSHLIPAEELANGGYEGLDEVAKRDKLKADFQRFIERRAELVMTAATLLEQGREVSAAQITGVTAYSNRGDGSAEHDIAQATSTDGPGAN